MIFFVDFYLYWVWIRLEMVHQNVRRQRQAPEDRNVEREETFSRQLGVLY